MTEMISRRRVNRILICGIMLLMIVMTGCKTPKNVAYFQDVTDAVILTAPAKPMLVEPTNRLMIVVKSKENSVNSLFNKAMVQDRVGEGYTYYTVTKEGMIDFPVLGMIKVEGMSPEQVSAFIKGEIMGRGYTNEVVVTVNIVDRGFSVLGEVNKPGEYGFKADEISLLEAISAAGDLTIQGQRENIKVIRQEKDGIHTYVVDITNLSELSKSPAFRVKQGDVIYVEPSNQRKRDSVANGNAVTNISFWVSIASLLTTVLVLFKK